MLEGEIHKHRTFLDGVAGGGEAVQVWGAVALKKERAGGGGPVRQTRQRQGSWKPGSQGGSQLAFQIPQGAQRGGGGRGRWIQGGLSRSSGWRLVGRQKRVRGKAWATWGQSRCHHAEGPRSFAPLGRAGKKELVSRYHPHRGGCFPTHTWPGVGWGRARDEKDT